MNSIRTTRCSQVAAGVLHFGDGTPKLQRGTGALQSHGSGPDSRSSQVEETVFWGYMNSTEPTSEEFQLCYNINKMGFVGSR